MKDYILIYLCNENCGGFLPAGEVITDFMLTDDHNWTDKWSKILVVC